MGTSLQSLPGISPAHESAVAITCHNPGDAYWARLFAGG